MAAVIAVSIPHVHARGVALTARPRCWSSDGGRRGARAYARSQRFRPGALHPSVYQRRRLGVLFATVTVVPASNLALTGLARCCPPNTHVLPLRGPGRCAASAAPVAPAQRCGLPVYSCSRRQTPLSIARPAAASPGETPPFLVRASLADRAARSPRGRCVRCRSWSPSMPPDRRCPRPVRHPSPSVRRGAFSP